ncbi:hypothetical protein ABW21_db0205625 [Orbilia brochopaga]|nr:hypothetical protein ABW21_db0205625 [Drechslerella brochopaga]
MPHFFGHLHEKNESCGRRSENGPSLGREVCSLDFLASDPDTLNENFYGSDEYNSLQVEDTIASELMGGEPPHVRPCQILVTKRYFDMGSFVKCFVNLDAH